MNTMLDFKLKKKKRYATSKKDLLHTMKNYSQYLVIT